MLAPGVNLQFQELGTPEAPLGKHPPHRALEEPLGVRTTNLSGRSRFQPAGPSARPVVDLLIFLAAGKPNPRGVEHDHMVTTVEERGPGRLVFPDQDPSYPTGEPAKRLILCVHDEPASPDFTGASEGRACRTRQSTEGGSRLWMRSGGMRSGGMRSGGMKNGRRYKKFGRGASRSVPIRRSPERAEIAESPERVSIGSPKNRVKMSLFRPGCAPANRECR